MIRPFAQRRESLADSPRFAILAWLADSRSPRLLEKVPMPFYWARHPLVASVPDMKRDRLVLGADGKRGLGEIGLRENRADAVRQGIPLGRQADEVRIEAVVGGLVVVSAHRIGAGR